MKTELLEFEIGSYKWALVKALQGDTVTHPFLNRESFCGAVVWDEEDSDFAVLGGYGADDTAWFYLSIFIEEDSDNTHETDKSWKVVEKKRS